MKLTKTQVAVVQKLAGKIQSTPFSCNHEDRAFDTLKANGFAEYHRAEGVTVRRLTEAGKKLAETL